MTDAYSGISKEDEDEVSDKGTGIGEQMLKKVRTCGNLVVVCVKEDDLVAEKGSGSVYPNTPVQVVQNVQKCRSTLQDALCIFATCAANGTGDPGVAVLRSTLSVNDPDADAGTALPSLGRPAPGIFASGNASGSGP
jgi:hypothetical protein